MDLPDGLLPPLVIWLSAILSAGLFMLALVTAPWSKIRDDEAQHVYFGAIFAVTLLWVMRGGIQSGLEIHLLWMTSLCLMFEWQFALFAACLVIAVTTFLGPAGWQAYPVNLLSMAILPIVFTRTLLYLCQKYLPHNYFIYIFINAFLAAAVSIALTVLCSAWLQTLAGAQPPGTIRENFVVILPMLMFGEAFINGGAMTLLVIYRPHWVATFHDRWYLRDQ